MENSVELKKEKWDLIHKCRKYLDERSGRDLNTEEKSEYGSMQKSLDEMDARIQRLEDLETKEGDDDQDQQDDGSGDSVENTDERDEEENSRKGRSLRSGNRWDTAAFVEEDYDTWVSRQMSGRRAYRGGKNYRAAWKHWLVSGGNRHPQYRDITIGTDSSGGYFALPTEISEQFVFNQNNLSFMRKVAYIEKLKQAKSQGVRQYTAIPVANWNGEIAQTSPDTNSVLNRRDLDPNLLSVIDTISLRTLQAAEDAEKYVLDRTNYAMLQAAETAYMTGSGSGQPLGIFTASSSGIPTSQDVVSSVALAKCFTGDDVIKTFYSMPQQYTMSPKFSVFTSRGSMSYIRTLKTSTGQYLLEPGLATNRPDTLLGAQVFMSEYAPGFNSASPTASQYVLCFGDYNWYHITEVTDGGSQDAPQMQILYERYADTHERGYVFRYWVDAAPVLPAAFARLQLAAS